MNLRGLVNEIVELELWVENCGICETIHVGCDCGCGGDQITNAEIKEDHKQRKKLKGLYKKIDNYEKK